MAARDALVLPARSRDVVLLALHDGGQFSVPVDVGARQLDCVLVELVGPQTRREARYRPLRAVDEGPRGTQRRAERQDKNTTRHLLYLCRSEEEGLRLLVTSSISAGSQPRRAVTPRLGDYGALFAVCVAGSPTCALTRAVRAQLFYSFFKTLVGKEIAVELKNDVRPPSTRAVALARGASNMTRPRWLSRARRRSR